MSTDAVSIGDPGRMRAIAAELVDVQSSVTSQGDTARQAAAAVSSAPLEPDQTASPVMDAFTSGMEALAALAYDTAVGIATASAALTDTVDTFVTIQDGGAAEVESTS